MRNEHDTPETLMEAVKFYADFEHCKAVMTEARWPDGIVRCPTCGTDHVRYMANTRRWKCYAKHPRPQFSLKVGTIFEDSPLGLDKWLVAVWLLADSKNGISSYELGRALGVTQKTAWFMLHRVRKAMQAGTFLKLDGEVEVDETFIGGKARNMHVAQRQRRITGTGAKDKTAVMGIVKRGGEVCTAVVPDRKKNTLQAEIVKNVEAGAALYSDDLRSLKRGIHGTYVSVEPFHLHLYLDEQTFRYNNRKMDDAGRFNAVLRQIVDKRLAYDELIGKAAMEKQRQEFSKEIETWKANN